MQQMIPEDLSIQQHHYRNLVFQINLQRINDLIKRSLKNKSIIYI